MERIIDNWTDEIEMLKAFYTTTKLPKTFQLMKHVFIFDVRAFVDLNIRIVEQNNGKKTFLPYLYRLLKLKYSIENGND